MANIEQRELRDVLGAYLTGVTVVTAVDSEGKFHGVTANSFSSVSLDPPLVLWSQSLNAKSFHAFSEGERFVVNILAEDQVDISNRFAKSGADKFSGVKIRPGLGGIPILEDCSAHLECVKIATYPGGDHAVFLGQVEKIHHARRKPLAFGGGRYMVAQDHDLGEGYPTTDSQRSTDLNAVRMATAALPEISRAVGHTMSIAVWGNHGPTVVRWEPSRNPVSSNLRTGVVLDASRSTAGKLFAAFRTAEFQNDRRTDSAALDPVLKQKLDKELLVIRRRRMSRSTSMRRSIVHGVKVTAFSAPVFDANGLMVLSLTVTAKPDELSRDWNGPVPQAILLAADSLSARLGYMKKETSQ